MDESFHDDLTGQRTSNSRVLEARSATANKVDKIPDFATAIKIPLLIADGSDKASYRPKRKDLGQNRF